MSHDVITHVLSADVADAGTVAVSYPNLRDSGSYEGGYDHRVNSNAYGELTAKDGEIAVAFGASSITITNNSGVTWEAQTELYIQVDRPGIDMQTTALANAAKMALMTTALISLGAPDTADPDGVCEAQSGAAGALTLDGALVSGGVATFDVPRNVVVDSGGADTATLTITGTDEYGVTITEDITLNGSTAVPGKKAFKTVTSVVSDATISNGAFVGTGDVLGLPVHLADTGYVIAELEDGAAASAGTIVAADNSDASATTGDVRGTYDPNSAADGSAAFQLIVAIPDPSYRGAQQA